MKNKVLNRHEAQQSWLDGEKVCHSSKYNMYYYNDNGICKNNMGINDLALFNNSGENYDDGWMIFEQYKEISFSNAWNMLGDGHWVFCKCLDTDCEVAPIVPIAFTYNGFVTVNINNFGSCTCKDYIAIHSIEKYFTDKNIFYRSLVYDDVVVHNSINSVHILNWVLKDRSDNVR